MALPTASQNTPIFPSGTTSVTTSVLTLPKNAEKARLSWPGWLVTKTSTYEWSPITILTQLNVQ